MKEYTIKVRCHDNTQELKKSERKKERKGAPTFSFFFFPPLAFTHWRLAAILEFGGTSWTNTKTERLRKLKQTNWWESSGASPRMLMGTTQLYLYTLLLTTQLDLPIMYKQIKGAENAIKYLTYPNLITKQNIMAGFTRGDEFLDMIDCTVR